MIAKLKTWFVGHWKAALALAGGVGGNAVALGLLDGTARTVALWLSAIAVAPGLVAIGPANKPAPADPGL